MVFGTGVSSELGAYVNRFGSRPFIVTGRQSAHRIGLLDCALKQLPSARLFDQVDENPDSTVCERGARICRELECDVLVALGGGSPIDAAKAIAVLATNPGACADYFGAEKFANPPLPIIAVPTTAGAGSEVTPYSVLVDAATRSKRTVSGSRLFPRVALLDPQWTRSLPRNVTIATGLDALSQAMEGIVSKRATPVGDVLASDAIGRIIRYLPRAADHGETDDEARAEMMYAAMLAGAVIAQSGTTLVHGMGYYYTLECGIAHGLANGLLLAPVFRFNARCAPERVALVAQALCVPSGESMGEAIAARIYELFDRLGVSSAARDHDVRDDQLPVFADDIVKDPYRFRNQVGEIDRERVFRFYEEAQRGR